MFECWKLLAAAANRFQHSSYVIVNVYSINMAVVVKSIVKNLLGMNNNPLIVITKYSHELMLTESKLEHC